MRRRSDGSGRQGGIASLPWFGLLLPLIVAVATWQITGNGLMLLFALLGPVSMVASLLDGRRQNARRTRTEEAERRRRDEREAAADSQRALVETARARLERPALADLLANCVPPPSIAPGVRSTIPGLPDDHSAVRIGIDDAGRPVLVPTTGVLRVVTGQAPHVVADAVVRSLTLTRAWWLGAPSADHLEVGPTAGSSRATHVVTVRADGTAEMYAVATPLVLTHMSPDALTRRQARAIERLIAARDAPEIRVEAVASVRAHHVASGNALLGLDDGGDAVGLSVVEHGPHILLAGPTGSGKTELLVTLLATWALRQSPAEFTFAIIDFKGGGGFVRLASLPHCRGITTDLDTPEVNRALVGLGHEMRERERLLSRYGVTDRDALPPEIRPARLLVVIDEFRAFSDAIPEARRAIADVMARGRALGVHVLAATQRAAGSFADDMVANTATRICLSPVSADDAWLMLGQRHGGTLASRHALVRRNQDEVIAVFPVMCDEAALVAATGNVGEFPAPAPTALWWPAIPPVIVETPQGLRTRASRSDGSNDDDDGESVPLPVGTSDTGQGLVVGLSASPHSTAWSVERWDCGAFPTLRISGPAHSGKSTLIRSVACQSDLPVYVLPKDPVTAFDAVANDAVISRRLVVADDFDVICEALGDEFREDFLRLWNEVVRSTTAAGGAVVTTDSGQPGAATRITAQSVLHITLGLPSGVAVGEGTAVRPGAGFIADRPFQAICHVDPGGRGTLAENARRAHSEHDWEHTSVPRTLPEELARTALVFSSRPRLWRERGIHAHSPDSWVTRDLSPNSESAPSVMLWDDLPRAQARLVGLDPTRIPPARSNTVVVLQPERGYRRYLWGGTDVALEHDSSGRTFPTESPRATPGD